MLLKFIVFIFSVSNKRDERENHCIPVEESERRWLELILAKKKSVLVLMISFQQEESLLRCYLDFNMSRKVDLNL